MEENPHFARGAPVFGSSKLSVEQQWWDLAEQLNSLWASYAVNYGVEKGMFLLNSQSLNISFHYYHSKLQTWADLKSRTKKKIAENSHSIRVTGGGSYSVKNLSHFEQQIDRTLCMSVSAAPKGKPLDM